ncbi:ecto-ADP-ribosyltransferase 5-like [Gasterosteus aculeatus]
MRMKMMMAVTVLWVVLLPYGVSGANLMSHAGRKRVATPPPPPPTPPPPPLDMAPNSVDDMYEGCADEMEKKAKDFLEEERKYDVFNENWETQKEECDGLYQPNETLSKEEITALCVYTSNETYADFNKATREQGPKYKTAFKYHALHFYLTRAVQKIKAEHDKKNENDSEKKCYTVFRRTDKSFSTKVLNKEVRFGSFASSSLRDDLTHFGDKSCFEIYTCMGADVSDFYKYENEAEVLIPPYEVFNVTEITKRSEQPQSGLWCDVVYKLKSTKKTKSTFNCALINKEALQVSCG